MYYRRYQQGGAAPGGADQMQQQIVQLVQAAMQGDEQAQQQVQQIMEAAQQGDQQAAQIAQMIQQVVEAMQSQAQRAQIGGKLAYIHRLRTGVGMDEEISYRQSGGRLVKEVRKKTQESRQEPAEKAPAKKAYFECSGGKARKTSGAKKCYFGGSLY